MRRRSTTADGGELRGMAVCTYCDEDPANGAGCTLAVHDDFVDGVTRRRIVNGTRQPCPTCATPPRSLHHHGCDRERCAACGRRAVSCTCRSSRQGPRVRVRK
jgi:hypothetical protein